MKQFMWNIDATHLVFSAFFIDLRRSTLFSKPCRYP